MRRPPSLPTPQRAPASTMRAEPDIAPEEAPTEADAEVRADDSARLNAAPVTSAEAWASASVLVDESDADAEARPVTSRDVWRAARARRRALRSEIRRFTKSSRRRRNLWLAGIAAVLVLVGGSVAAAYSPLFALEKVTVVGASALDAKAVEASLAGELGTPLALLDEARIKAALTAFPLIETYSLEARPPHDLTVRIVERTPIGVVQSPAGFTLVDAAGVALATTATRPDGQPLLQVEGGVDSAAFRSAGLVIRSVSAEIRDRITAVSAESADSVTLSLGSIKVIWGSADRSPDKSVALDGIMTARPDARSYDVSSPEAVVVR